MVLFDDTPEDGSFRRYLHSAKLPYYSIREHIESTTGQSPSGVRDEQALLNELDDGDTTGLIITGPGGIGKTRLTLELGHLARKDGWLVLSVLNRLTSNALESLAQIINPEIKVLFLIDYAETHRDFADITETLSDYNGTYSFQLRYVASARSSYYPMVSGISQHKHVDLAPPTHEATGDWFTSYRKSSVRRILEHSGLTVTAEHIDVCKDTPVFAVFLTYLHQTGRYAELEQLLKDRDFGRWVTRRVQLSFGKTAIERSLAMLIAAFPMTNDVVITRLNNDIYRPILDILANDGWVEKVTRDGVEWWVTAHDVLADKILSLYVS
ncbi:MAG: ATP-binding protein, partial [Chloroflexi bacterium]|nr:ATP-binding protein [Chloroflexota bacterium]